MVQWRNLNRRKISILSVGVITGVVVILAVAIQSNWFDFADMTGTIQKNEVTITKAQINLGNIASGASFESTDTATINVPVTEKGGLNVTKLFLVLSVSSLGVFDEYLMERFTDLYLNITIQGTTYNLGIVIGGVFQTTGTHDWTYDTGESGTYYYYYKNWPANIFLSTGSQNIDLKAYGVTSAPSTDLTVDIKFAFELT